MDRYRPNGKTKIRQRARLRLAASLVVAAPVVSGCRAFFDYPSASGESSAAACVDGTDNDFDGLIDCADPDCDGRCAEGDPATCADGRDNDGDGRRDERDPRCWHLTAPSVARCTSAEPVDFEARFDTTVSEQSWFPFGLRAEDGAASSSVQPPRDRQDRPDNVLGFAPAKSKLQTPTGLVSTTTFDGDWRSFSLAFAARVAAPGLLRVGLVSAGQSGEVSAPQSPELAPVLLEIDARTSPQLRVSVNGSAQTAAWRAGTDWHDLRLTAGGESLELSLDDEVFMQLSRASLGRQRLAIWGQGDGQTDGLVQLDDLSLKLAGGYPCATAVPQIPFGNSCDRDRGDNAGYTVSVASDDDLGHCAVITTGPLGQEKPDGAQSWTSSNGLAWNLAGTMPLPPESYRLRGVGVARDAQAGLWRAAFTSSDGEAVSVGVSSSPDCGAWSTPAEVATLPQDAAAPSYLIPGVAAPYEVYFTRPAAGDQGASLWRLSSADGDSFTPEPERVAVFDPTDHVADPAALTRAGNDLLLVHAIDQSSGQLGVGLRVAADDTLATWRRAAKWPFLEPDPTTGQFDTDLILAGTVFWERGDPRLLYGALGTPVRSEAGSAPLRSITTGTAVLTMTGDASPQAGSSPQAMPGACGDGTCAAEEDCDSCPADCAAACDGTVLAVERFDSTGDWELTGLGDESTRQASLYVSSTSERMAIAPGPAAWYARALDAPVHGDFELSFDVRIAPPAEANSAERCTALVGLALPGTTTTVEASGLFLQLDRQLPCSDGAPAFAPQVRVRGEEVDSIALLSLVPGSGSACVGVVTGQSGSWQRVRLTRRGGKLSASSSAQGTCEASVETNASLDYVGPFDGFDRILVGWGRSFQPRGAAVDCGDPAAQWTIDNIVLQSLPCEDASLCTDPETGQSFCTDLNSSPEHCGGCFLPVELAQVCKAGQPRCGQTECVVPGVARPFCVDTLTDVRHCGACNAELGELETCGSGFARAKMVTMPEGFAIDATVVTRAQYAAWLATKPSTAEQLPECLWNDVFKPTCAWPPADKGDFPVVCVDWCDASGYCSSVGKRLCGGIDGGPGSFVVGDPRNQWNAACSSGGKYKYPYGDEYDPLACNGRGRRPADAPYQCALTLPVASLPTCQSPEPGYQGVYDMAGNVDEWTGECVDDAGENDECGMEWKDSCQEGAGTACNRDVLLKRSERLISLGFRCCSL